MDYGLFFPILTTLAFFALFSGIGVAFYSANKLPGQQGALTSRILAYFGQKTALFNATVLVGKTLSLVLYALYMSEWTGGMLRGHLPGFLSNGIALVMIQTLLSTLVVLFTAFSLSKSLARANPNLVLSALAIPFLVTYIPLFPLVFLIISLSKLAHVNILHLEKPFWGISGPNPFRDMGSLNEEEAQVQLDTKIFHNALEFKTVQVRHCMIPRTEIIGIEVDEGIDRLKEVFIESGHSKIIVYKETMDDVIGYCHSSALFKGPEKIEDILTPIILVPETSQANDLLIRFIHEHKSLAAVLDEFGGTSGIVSMEDIIEEIFGEIEDEFDEDNLTEHKLSDRTYLLSARLEIDYLNETYSWNLPEGDYETLGGLILAYGDFPKEGDTIHIPPFTLTVKLVKGNKIELIKLEMDEPSQQT